RSHRARSSINLAQSTSTSPLRSKATSRGNWRCTPALLARHKACRRASMVPERDSLFRTASAQLAPKDPGLDVVDALPEPPDTKSACSARAGSFVSVGVGLACPAAMSCSLGRSGWAHIIAATVKNARSTAGFDDSGRKADTSPSATKVRASPGSLPKAARTAARLAGVVNTSRRTCCTHRFACHRLSSFSDREAFPPSSAIVFSDRLSFRTTSPPQITAMFVHRLHLLRLAHEVGGDVVVCPQSDLDHSGPHRDRGLVGMHRFPEAPFR